MKAKTKEETIEAYLGRRVREIGGEVRKVQWIGRKSAPDRLVMLPVRLPRIVEPFSPFAPPKPPCFFWVELKRPGLAATFPKDAHERAQHREHERMRAFGQTVLVIDSKEGVDALLA